MSIVKYDNVWKLMSQNNFKMDPDSTNENLNCIICKHLMIDSFQSTCGCRFCFKCISDYLKYEERYCPGDKDECKDDHLVLDVNVSRDVRTNNAIYKTLVVCPNDFCHAHIQLREMEEHLRICNKKCVACPFERFGCENKKLSSGKLTEHLQKETMTHTYMLLDIINTLTNEINNLKEGFEVSRTEIAYLREDSVKKENRILMLEEESMNMKNALMVLEGESIEKENRLLSMQEEINNMKNTAERNLESNIEAIINHRVITNQQMEIENLRIQCNYSTNMMKTLRDSVNEIQAPGKKQKNQDRLILYWIKWNSLCPNVDEDFMWKIDDCMRKKDTFLFSDKFYAHNYKFFMHFCIYGNDNIKLGCYIAKGDHDYSLPWPMKRAIYLSIVDQDTLSAYKTETYNYATSTNKNAYSKPKNDTNDYIGGQYFIKYSSIADNPSVVANDSIVVSFRLGYL